MKKILLYLGVMLCFISCASSKVNALELSSGDYKSYDNKHTITIDSGGNSYDNKYTLTLSKNDKGSKLTGKLGTDNKTVTFYQLNDSKIINMSALTYLDNGSSVTIGDYLVFSMNKEPVIDANGKFELWRSNVKLNAYADLQSAVDASQNGDVIKITSNLDILGGVYVSGKEITIDGCNTTLNASTWLNTIFLVDADATLNIKNLTIDGGAPGFEVDKSSINIQKDTSTKIPIKTGSDTSDIKRNFSIILSKGSINISNSKLQNSYINGDGATLKVLSGNVLIKDSIFDHNRATGKGGSVYLGSNMSANEKVFPVQSAKLDNVEFKNNYANYGGALFLVNVTKTEIDKTTFKSNVVTGGKGAAILAGNQSYRSDVVGYLPILNIDNSLFEGNWVGNDGSAMEINDAALTVKNSTFRKNVGIHSSSSCGCISFVSEGLIQRKGIFENCVFEENLGSASVIADHGTAGLTIDILNTKFLRNKAVYNTFLIYSANVNLVNSVFENEHASRAILDLRPAVTPKDLELGYTYPVVNVKDVSFKNTQYNVTDILIRRYSDDETILPITVNLSGNVDANIDLWDKNKLEINGNHTGYINVGKGNIKDNVKVSPNAVLSKDINYAGDKHIITLLFYGLEEKDGYNWEARRYIYSDTKTFTRDEFFMEHMVSEDGYELKYYTDAAFTTPWDYSVEKDMTVYGRWEEHTHNFNNYVVYDNAIHEQCECGYLGKKISLEVPTDLIFDNKDKDIIVNDELELGDNYQLIYLMLKNNTWEEIDSVPRLVGTYKAVLRYNNLEIEKEYKIENAPVKEDNPETGDKIIYTFISFIISLSMIILIIIKIKKYTKN